MSPHVFEESNSDSQLRWEDDGGVIPLHRSSPTTRAVLTLKSGRLRTVASFTPKPHIKRALDGLPYGQ